MTVFDRILRRRLRRRAFDQMLHGEINPNDCKRLMFEENVANEVLARIDAEKDAGDGSLWEFILNIPWLKLAAIIAEVLALLGESEEDTV